MCYIYMVTSLPQKTPHVLHLAIKKNDENLCFCPKMKQKIFENFWQHTIALICHFVATLPSFMHLYPVLVILIIISIYFRSIGFSRIPQNGQGLTTGWAKNLTYTKFNTTFSLFRRCSFNWPEITVTLSSTLLVSTNCWVMSANPAPVSTT